MITLTEKAADKLKEVAKEEKKEGQGLRLVAMPGGCSGMQYVFDFEETAKDEDEVVEQHGFKLFIDKDSLKLLDGSTIDFIETEETSGFKIDNPNVQSSCDSCGGGCH